MKTTTFLAQPLTSDQPESVQVVPLRAQPTTAAQTSGAIAPALVWSDELVTGHSATDAAHRKFVVVVNDLVAASEANLLERLRAFEAYAHEHFGEEDALMRSTAYPSAGCHTYEHAAVLKSVSEVIEVVSQGNFAIGYDIANELVRWFPEHTHHMDKSLTAWLCKRSNGAGAPLVFQRGKPAVSRLMHER